MRHRDKYSQHSLIIWPVWLNGSKFVYKLSSSGFELLLLLLLLLLLCHFIAFAQAVLKVEVFLLGELQLVAKGQEDTFILHV